MTTTSEIGMPAHSAAIAASAANTPAAIATPIMDTSTNIINNYIAANSNNIININHNSNNPNNSAINSTVLDTTIDSTTNSISTTPLPGSTPTPQPCANGNNGAGNSNGNHDTSSTIIKSSAKVRRGRKRRLLHKSKQTTGYIIYASEIRKDIIKQYPNREFGDISKIVGIEWKNLPQETKAEYEKRAQALNAKYKALAAQSPQPQSTPNNRASPSKHRHNSADSSVHYGSSTCNSPYQIGSDSQTQFSLPDTQQQQSSSNSATHCEQNGFFSSSNTTNSHLNNNGLSANTNNSFNHRSTLPSPDNASTNNKPSDVYSHQIHHNYANNNQQLNSSVSTPGFICVTNDPNHGGQQFRQNNIIYRKPAAVRLRPRDTCTQTDPIKWVDRSQKGGAADGDPKKRLQFSQKFIEYLANKVNRNISNGNNTDVNNVIN